MKLILFIDDIIVYMEILKERQNKTQCHANLLKLISNSSMVLGYKANS